MNRRLANLARLVALPALLAHGAIAAPAVSAGSPCFHGYVMPPASTGAGTDIKLMPCSFEPTVTTVAVGQEVTFHNGPEYTHLITGANQEWGSRDVEVQPNATISFTFDEPGVYPYACALHSGMSGAIVVGDLEDGLAAGSTGSTGSNDSTGTSTGAQPAPPDAAPSNVSAEAATNVAPLVVLGIVAGLVAGAAVVWLVMRWRTVRGRAFVHAE